MPLPLRLALAAASALLVTACGVNGKPEYPAGTPTTTVTKADGSMAERPAKPTRPFALDGLLN